MIAEFASFLSLTGNTFGDTLRFDVSLTPVTSTVSYLVSSNEEFRVDVIAVFRLFPLRSLITLHLRGGIG